MGEGSLHSLQQKDIGWGRRTRGRTGSLRGQEPACSIEQQEEDGNGQDTGRGKRGLNRDAAGKNGNRKEEGCRDGGKEQNGGE